MVGFLKFLIMFVFLAIVATIGYFVSKIPKEDGGTIGAPALTSRPSHSTNTMIKSPISASATARSGTGNVGGIGPVGGVGPVGNENAGGTK